jgi:glutaredoxin-related protein
MTEPTTDLGIATAILTEFTSHRLPKAQLLKEKVERGELLDEFDLVFLHEVMDNAQRIKHLVDQHPEYQEVYARAAALYGEITEKALLNEKNAHPAG